MNNIVESFNKIKLNIEKLKPKKKVNIVAISKTFPLSHIKPLIDHGHLHFGENKVQEANSKWKDLKLQKKNPKNISIVDSFGKLNYFSAINSSRFLLGNTSSGIIEAASFGKYVLNVGQRQAGRTRSKNTIDISYNVEEILRYSKLLLRNPKYKEKNNYEMKNTTKNILSHTLNFLK